MTHRRQSWVVAPVQNGSTSPHSVWSHLPAPVRRILQRAYISYVYHRILRTLVQTSFPETKLWSKVSNSFFLFNFKADCCLYSITKMPVLGLTKLSWLKQPTTSRHVSKISKSPRQGNSGEDGGAIICMQMFTEKRTILLCYRRAHFSIDAMTKKDIPWPISGCFAMGVFEMLHTKI